MIKGDTLIFFDEVQECPDIVTAIKFLVDDGSYRYILSGSLLGVELKDIRSVPVGYMGIKEMFPIDFEEFISCVGIRADVIASIKEAWEKRHPVDGFIHEKMMELFRLYLIVGGMPAAVSKYIESNNLQEVLTVQQEIIQLYKKDIAKYDPDNKLYIEEIFSLIPPELNAKNKRFILKRLNENAKQLAKLMDDHGYDYAVVKGQTLAQLYPKPLLRVPGDIDFYVKEADAQKVRGLIEKEWEIQIKDASVDDHKHYPFKYNASNYELHYRLANFSYPPHQRYFDHLVDTMPRKDVIIDGTHVKTLQPTLNLFYTFVHMYHHLRKMGVALRQLCDVAVIIRHHNDEIDRTLLAEILDKTNYRKAFAAFGSIIVEKLGVPEEEFPITISEKDRKWGKKILDDMLRHGNWGKYERETREKKWSIGHSLGTARLLISRYFKYFSLTPTDNIAFLTITSPELFFASVKKLSRKYWRKHVGK